MTPRLRVLILAASAVFFVSHVRALPRTLEDLDSVNFALAVEKFDVGDHRPHPPGYPVYVALAKASTSVLRAVAPSWDRDRSAAGGLALLGLLAGTAAAFVFTEFWIAAGLTPAVAFFAALLAIVSPLFWFTAARPLSDAPALVAAVAVQTLFMRGLRLVRTASATPFPRRWLWAALASGLLIGMRSQTMWLTGPLLVWCAGELAVARRGREALALIGAAAIGALLWAIPLVWLSGGLQRYLSLLGSQGAADFYGVEMLATTPTWRLFKIALYRTFIWPWVAPALAYVVLLLSAAGAVVLIRRGPRLLAAVLLGYWPYLLFHLTYQETLTLRYALPLVVPVAGLAAVGGTIVRTRYAAIPIAAVAAASLWLAQPRLDAYARQPSGLFHAFQDMQRALPAMAEPPVLRMHHQVWWGIQRELDWYHPYWDVGPQPHPGQREWLAIVNHWQSGLTRPVWFLTDITRTDIAAFDARNRTRRGQYELPAEVRRLMPTPRLEDVGWWEIRRPAWMLGNGWSLTPELAGMTASDAAGPHQRGAEAFLLRRPAPLTLMIGGRYLAPGGSPPGILTAELDGRAVSQWRLSGDPIWFVQWIELPSGTGDGPGPYATLTVRVTSDDPARPAPMVGLEQFDAASSRDVSAAFAEGWQEPEEDPRTGRSWRWSSDRSVWQVRSPAEDLLLTVSGESPLKYFDRAPQVVVRAGDRELGRFTPTSDFTQQIDVPAAALAAASGRLTIETDLSFVPAERGPSPDRRRLGLKIYDMHIGPKAAR
jgi:hypothetical protein